MKLLEGKKALIFGVANNRSIAWAIAQTLHEHGAEIGIKLWNSPTGKTRLSACGTVGRSRLSRSVMSLQMKRLRTVFTKAGSSILDRLIS